MPPDVPRNPDVPRYFLARRISAHLIFAAPAGNTSGSCRPLPRIAIRGESRVTIRSDVIMNGVREAIAKANEFGNGWRHESRQDTGG